ncbi:MAG: hypothetical protein LBE67_11930 [Kocuria palustris]|nr:hypothetical protein [Kocuria palustris]
MCSTAVRHGEGTDALHASTAPARRARSLTGFRAAPAWLTLPRGAVVRGRSRRGRRTAVIALDQVGSRGARFRSLPNSSIHRGTSRACVQS